MDNTVVFVVALFGIGLSVWFAASFTRWFRTRQLGYYARRVGLHVPEELEEALGRRVVALERSAAGGGLAGLIVSSGIVWMLPKSDFPSEPSIGVGAPVVVMTVILGSMITRAITAVTLTMRAQPGRRVARSTTPHLSDYVPMVELLGSLLAAGGAVVLVVLAGVAISVGRLDSLMLSDDGGEFWSVEAMFGYLALVTAVAACLLSQIVLRAAQRAGSRQELAWDDALRASTLRALVGVPISWGIQSLYLSFLDVTMGATWHPGILGFVAGTVFALAAATTLALLLVDRRAKPNEYFLQRLWRNVEMITR